MIAKDFVRNKRVTVIGAAKSGQAAARLIVRQGGTARISDNGPEKLSDEFKMWAAQNNVALEWNGHTQNFIEASDFLVLEISSFQLETIVDFKPHVAVFNNFSQNHLDRHKDVDEYFEAKTRLFFNQDKNDFAVLNAQDARIKSLAPTLKAKVSFFNQERTDNPNYLAVTEVASVLGIDKKICDKVF